MQTCIYPPPCRAGRQLFHENITIISTISPAQLQPSDGGRPCAQVTKKGSVRFLGRSVGWNSLWWKLRCSRLGRTRTQAHFKPTTRFPNFKCGRSGHFEPFSPQFGCVRRGTKSISVSGSPTQDSLTFSGDSSVPTFASDKIGKSNCKEHPPTCFPE